LFGASILIVRDYFPYKTNERRSNDQGNSRGKLWDDSRLTERKFVVNDWMYYFWVTGELSL
jgi:hypothetical protein